MRDEPNEYDKALETMTRRTNKLMTGTGTGLKKTKKPAKTTKKGDKK